MKTLNNNKNQNIPKLDFIGIGAPRAGTTWLATCLREHPQICLSKPKEVDFFNKEHSFIIKKDFNYNKGFAWYAQHFKHCQPTQKIGEFSVSYFSDKEAPKLIHKHYPNIKMIVCLRNPIEQLWSNYQVSLAHSSEYPDLLSALHKEPNFINRSLYGKNLARFLKYFKPEQFFFIIYEQDIQQPQQTIQNLYEWLGVNSDFIPPSLNKRINSKQERKGVLRKKFLQILTKSKKIPAYSLVQILKKVGIIFIAQKLDKLLSLNTKSSKIDKKTREQLKKIFYSDISALEKLINKDLSIWKK